MAVFTGGCHCGNVAVRFDATRPPGALGVRDCGCGFCQRHGARYACDPSGSLDVTVADQDRLIRYRFGHRVADFLVCAVCGVFVCAVTAHDGTTRAVLNINVLDTPDAFPAEATAMDYDGEGEDDRTSRWAARWTPATLSATISPGRS